VINELNQKIESKIQQVLLQISGGHMPIKCRFSLMMVASLILAVGINTVYASELIQCSAESKKTGQDFKVKGEGIFVRKGPGQSYEKISSVPTFS
jgi:hypothetical protein